MKVTALPLLDPVKNDFIQDKELNCWKKKKKYKHKYSKLRKRWSNYTLQII